MLILRRKIGERIVIDGRIEVTVLQVRGGKVRLGFSAPRDVRVLREEVLRPATIDVAAGDGSSDENHTDQDHRDATADVEVEAALT
jgi:carbon storage regulator